MNEKYKEQGQNSTPEGHEQSNDTLAERHKDMCREMNNLIEEESRLVAEAVEGPINIDRLSTIHSRQNEILAEQWQIEQELGKRLAG